MLHVSVLDSYTNNPLEGTEVSVLHGGSLMETGQTDAEGISTLTFLPTAVERVSGIPASFEVSKNYPNPFNTVTTIGYEIPVREFVTLQIFNSLGQEFETLINEKLGAGIYTISWDATGLASGAYIYRMETTSFSKSKKLLFLK